MNIWIMNHYATSMFFDRAGRHYWFARELTKRGYKVTVFCATTLLNNENEVDTNRRAFTVKKEDNVPFVFVKAKKCKGNGIDRVYNMLSFAMNLIPSATSYAKKYGKPDVILASSVHPLTLVAGEKLAKKFKVPCICEIRDLWPQALFDFGAVKENSAIGQALVKGEHWIYKNANALIFLKEGDTDYLKDRKWTTEQGGDIDLKICHYINNGIYLSDYEKHISEDVLDDADLNDSNSFNVVYTGTIRPTNNVGNILTVAEILKKKGYENIKFLIYGEGIELENLRERAAEENITNAKLKGFVDRKYIPFILSHSSLNLLNYAQSKYDFSRGNSSNKLFEYMASGKPVLSTIKMGYSIIEKYHCGSELGSDDPEVIADEIIRYYEMPEEERNQLGRNAYEGSKDFDFNALTDRLEEVIKSVA